MLRSRPKLKAARSLWSIAATTCSELKGHLRQSNLQDVVVSHSLSTAQGEHRSHTADANAKCDSLGFVIRVLDSYPSALPGGNECIFRRSASESGVVFTCVCECARTHVSHLVRPLCEVDTPTLHQTRCTCCACCVHIIHQSTSRPCLPRLRFRRRCSRSSSSTSSSPRTSYAPRSSIVPGALLAST